MELREAWRHTQIEFPLIYGSDLNRVETTTFSAAYIGLPAHDIDSGSKLNVRPDKPWQNDGSWNNWAIVSRNFSWRIQKFSNLSSQNLFSSNRNFFLVSTCFIFLQWSSTVATIVGIFWSKYRTFNLRFFDWRASGSDFYEQSIFSKKTS